LIGLAAGNAIGRNSVVPAAAQVARYQLVGHGTLAGARGTVVNLKVEEVALVNFNGLPPLAKGKVYELWLITPGGHPDSAGVFVPDSNGGKVVLVGLPLTGYSQMAVTSEDAPNGSPTPSQQPELYGNLG
jgi:anti-sigma-K factor RskA